jgi:MOSC domain-containing protein YiiM
MGKITHLFRAPKKRVAMEELKTVVAVENVGFEKCAHRRPNGKRQVLLVDEETLDTIGLAPGIIRENITTRGLDVNALKAGERLKAGEVELVVSAVCEPCELMEEIRTGLLQELVGRRGMLCRVARGGILRCGEEIVVVEARNSREVDA